MKVRWGNWAAWLLAIALAGCGGGGGGDTGGAGGGGVAPSNPEGAWLSFDPVAPSVSQYEGESVPVAVNATSSRTFSAPFNVAILDSKGVITTRVDLSSLSQLSYRATLRTSPSLSAGSHSTLLEVRVCEDDPRTCARPFPGSPWHLPLSVQVKPKADAAGRLTLSVPSVSVTTYPGEAESFNIEAQLNSELNGRMANIGLFDPASLTVTPLSQSTMAQGGRYVFNVSTVTDKVLAAGTYTSDLQLRICQDAVATCELPVAGSPWIIPLTLTVKSAINLSPLQNVEGLGAWTTYQGNAAHTGFAAGSFDVAAFSRRWKIAAPGNYSQPYMSTAIDNGRVFYTRIVSGNRWELVSVSEDSGQIAWVVDMGTLSRVNSPAVGNGRVYVTSTGHQDSFLWVYDQASGALVQKLKMTSQWSRYSAPTVYGTDVYSIDGYHGGLSKYTDRSSSFNWSVPATIQDGWAPSTNGRFAYTYSTPDNHLLAFDVADGRLAFSIGEPYNFSTYFTAAPVVLADDQLGIVVSGSLMAFDLATRKRAWVMSMASSGIPAVGNGTVYAFGANGTVLEAHDPKTGDLLWTSQNLGTESYSSVIVTRNLAFVSSRSKTLAIDLGTRKVVWSYPLGGNLAISARGVLTILSDVGALAAVNLR